MGFNQKEYNRKYHLTKMGRASMILGTYKRMDRKNGFGDTIDFDARWIVENIFTKKCSHCDETDWKKLGCNRIDNDKPHTKDNVEPCCYKCNIELNLLEYKSRKRVYQYTLDGKLINSYSSTQEAAKENNYSQGCISSCCNEKYGYKTYKGYKWSYKPL